jgi:hypothetical protein
VPAERSWTVPATTDASEELALASAFAASTVLPLASCVAVAAAGCAVAAAGSVAPGVLSELSDVAVPVWVVVADLAGVIFGATGAVAATAVATVVAGVAVCGFTGVVVGWPVEA